MFPANHRHWNCKSIKDILGLPKKTPLSLTQEKKSRRQKESHRKPDGISREVYALTSGVAPLMPSVDLKRRPPADEKVRVVNDVPPTGDILKYTDDEYENHLTDPVWTKEETDQLFEL